MADISCTFDEPGSDPGDPGGGGREKLTALLRKPEGFRGTPIFADARQVGEENCHIDAFMGKLVNIFISRLTPAPPTGAASPPTRPTARGSSTGWR